MKKLSNLKGAKALSKKEQKSINGGFIPDYTDECGEIILITTESECYNHPVSERPLWTPLAPGSSLGECSILVGGDECY